MSKEDRIKEAHMDALRAAEDYHRNGGEGTAARGALLRLKEAKRKLEEMGALIPETPKEEKP